MLQLFDTARGQVVPFETREPGKVSMYVCGPTVYGPPHLGHGRFSLVFDVLRRYLEWSGYEVTYVSNITDIDDKIIERANAEGRPAEEIARKCEKVWWKGMDGIGVERPTHDPHATAYVEQMVAFIGRAGRPPARPTRPPTACTSRPRRWPTTACWPASPSTSLRGRGPGRGRRRQARRPSTSRCGRRPSRASRRGPRRGARAGPGWHTECVVMSLDLLGDGFDLHGGGQDLAFPHHENERAQAVALGHTFARHWMHNGFVEVGGEKMSKSLGNFDNLLDLIQSTDPRAYRLLVLRSHYRSPGGGHQGHRRRRRRPRCAASTRSSAGPASWRRAEPDGRCARRVPPADGRRPQHARAPSACCSPWCAGATRPSTPTTTPARPTSLATVRQIAEAVGLGLAAWPTAAGAATRPA